MKNGKIKKTENKNLDNKSIEKTFERLDKIINVLNSDKCSLEESIKYYDEGVKLVKDAKKMIDKIEKKLEVIEDGIEE